MASNYDKAPFVDSGAGAEVCAAGWDEIAARLAPRHPAANFRLGIECYPGIFEEEIVEALKRRLSPAAVFSAARAYRDPEDLRALFARDLTEDPVFGRRSGAMLQDFFDPARLLALRAEVSAARGSVLVIGAGASLLTENFDYLVYADMARWELQRRQREHLIGNLGLGNMAERAGELYKRAFFLDWRAADWFKLRVLPRADFVLDTNTAGSPKMIAVAEFRRAIARAVGGPLRLVPFFDPGPWGGQWMRERFDLPEGPPNYAWCFDCVPEENSLLLGFGDRRFEIPAQDLVLFEPRALMGEAVHARFGLDFPIRFDLLDTMGGGNLSFQVHPLTEYIQAHFGMAYTQDESYYMLDAGKGAQVFLGLREGIDREEMAAELEAAQAGDTPFHVEEYANSVPAKKHDHFLIPAGTPHCSGANSMVLEISATPYIFTFKLWDWGRLGLDGRPRPVHLEHGLGSIQWDRTKSWVKRELVNAIVPVRSGDGWNEERTGLHEREFIETRRHWFTTRVEHDTQGGVNVLNLVEGREIVVESPEREFAPFAVHYAETFVVPAAVGRYTIRPRNEGERCATIKAFVKRG